MFLLVFHFSFTYTLNKCNSNFISQVDSPGMCSSLAGNDCLAVLAGTNEILHIITRRCYKERTRRWNPFCFHLGFSVHFYLHHTPWRQNAYKVPSVLCCLFHRELAVSYHVGSGGLSSSPKYMVLSTTTHIFYCPLCNGNYIHDFILSVFSSKRNPSSKPHPVKFLTITQCKYLRTSGIKIFIRVLAIIKCLCVKAAFEGL